MTSATYRFKPDAPRRAGQPEPEQRPDRTGAGGEAELIGHCRARQSEEPSRNVPPRSSVQEIARSVAEHNAYLTEYGSFAERVRRMRAADDAES